MHVRVRQAIKCALCRLVTLQLCDSVFQDAQDSGISGSSVHHEEKDGAAQRGAGAHGATTRGMQTHSHRSQACKLTITLFKQKKSKEVIVIYCKTVDILFKVKKGFWIYFNCQMF